MNLRAGNQKRFPALEAILGLSRLDCPSAKTIVIYILSFLQTTQSQPFLFLCIFMSVKPAPSKDFFTCSELYIFIPCIILVHFSSLEFSPFDSLQIIKVPLPFKTRYTCLNASLISGQKYIVSNAVIVPSR